jgi:hypothetical protein
MKKILIILGFVLLLSSCFITKKKREQICNDCKTYTIEYIRDSIYIRDTAVIIKPDSASIDALMECDSLGNVRVSEITTLQGNLTKLETKIKDNRFKVKCKSDTIKVHIKGNTEIKWRIKEKIVERPVVEYKDYWWKWPLIIWAVLTTLYTLITYKNPLRSFIKRLF